jgi:hypothetical protein
MTRRTLPSRIVVVVVLAWVIGLTGARDSLHNHSGLTERPDCPACRLERAVGVTTSVTAALAITALMPVGAVPDSHTADFVSGHYALEPPPRSPLIQL